MVLATACLGTWKPHSMGRHKVATNCTRRGGMKNASAVNWAGALLCAASGACAQGYPPKPIRIVVGFPAGGGNDIIARMVGAKMQENWAQPVVIDHAARQRNRRHVGQPRAVRSFRTTCSRISCPSAWWALFRWCSWCIRRRRRIRCTSADVAVLDTNRAHVEAIRGHGLALTGRTESVTKLAAFASAAEMGPQRFDAVVILASPTGFEPVLPP